MYRSIEVVYVHVKNIFFYNRHCLHCTGYVNSAIYTYGHLEMSRDNVTSTR